MSGSLFSLMFHDLGGKKGVGDLALSEPGGGQARV